MTLPRIAAVVLAAIVADDRPPRGDLERLWGTWEAAIGPGGGSPIVLCVRGSACEIRSIDADGEAVVTTAELRLDPAADPPAWDATRRLDGDGRPMPDLKGIYRFEADDRGERLRLAHNGPGKARPTAFGPVRDGQPVVTVFRRTPAPDR